MAQYGSILSSQKRGSAIAFWSPESTVVEVLGFVNESCPRAELATVLPSGLTICSFETCDKAEETNQTGQEEKDLRSPLLILPSSAPSEGKAYVTQVTASAMEY